LPDTDEDIYVDESGRRFRLLDDDEADEPEVEDEDDARDFDTILQDLEGYQPEPQPEPEPEPQPPSWLDGEGWDGNLAKEFAEKAAERRKEIENASNLANPPVSEFDDLIFTQSELAGFPTEVLEKKLSAKLEQIEDTFEEAAKAATAAKKMRLEKLAKGKLDRDRFNLEWELKQRRDEANFERMKSQAEEEEKAEKERYLAEREANELRKVNTFRKQAGMKPLEKLE
jgi:hypothetical protein